MSQQQPDNNIQHLAAEAGAALRQQAEQAASQAAARPAVSPLRMIVALALVVASTVVIWVQFPRFHEPFGRPDGIKDQAVAEADLKSIALLLQAYRISQGGYPARLEQLGMPEGMAAFVARHDIAYQPTATAYRLEWNLPRGLLSYDGASGDIALRPAER